jgi:hypothetical protein
MGKMGNKMGVFLLSFRVWAGSAGWAGSVYYIISYFCDDIWSMISGMRFGGGKAGGQN